MKQEIFVCILSLSLCVSSPVADSTQEKPAPELAPKNVIKPIIDPVTSAPIAPTDKTKTDNTTMPPVTPNDNKTTPEKAPTTLPTVPTSPDTNTTTAKPTTTTVKPATNATTVKPDDKTTSTAAPITSTTLKPAESTTPKPLARSFDGPSFMGGIILTLGMLAIGFMGFKYYKSQTERNYHTL